MRNPWNVMEPDGKEKACLTFIPHQAGPVPPPLSGVTGGSEESMGRKPEKNDCLDVL